MSNLKIKCFGSRIATSQVARIESGFRELGHEIIESGPADFVYSNDPEFYSQALTYAQIWCCSSILNVLDVAKGLWSEKQLIEITTQLAKADYVTSISKTTQKDVIEYLDAGSGVIYQPTMPVSYLGTEKENEYLLIGRLNDPNKRISLAKQAFKELGETGENITCVGPEFPGMGSALGVISEELLNQIYNASKFVIFPSKKEGLGLPIVEALITSAIPICCNDCEAAKEFCPDEFLCDPTAKAIADKIREVNADYPKFKEIALSYGREYKEMFSPKTIAQNILNVYNSIT